MNAEWETFLQMAGARIADGEVQDFGDASAELAASLTKTALVDLSDWAFVRAGGSDALAFLNGQLTNDLTTLDDNHYRLAAYCDPKGRVITLFWIWRDGDSYLLMLPATLVQSVVERLQRYVLRAKVSIVHDVNLTALGVVGTGAAAVLGITNGTSSRRVTRADGFTALAMPGVTPRFLVVTTDSRRPDLWQRFGSKAKSAGRKIWRWHDIQAGIPTVVSETSELFVPQMLNLDQLEGINFKKGCYPGQEIVARMHYLGKLKQRLYRLFAPGNVAPLPGTRIYAAQFGDQAAGTVVTGVALQPDRVEILAVVQIACAESDRLRLGQHEGPVLTVEPLPKVDSLASG